MNKRQAKIEALYIAASLCTGTDMGMFNIDDPMPSKDQNKIVEALWTLGQELEKRADRLNNK